MKNQETIWNEALEHLNLLIEHQQKVLLKAAREIVPHATSDDVLQPNDFPELENNAYFRYEEGTLAGLYSAAMALVSFRNELSTD